MRRRASQRGFTLLEVLVATAIMGIAVAGVMSGLAASARNAARITEYDRAAMLAQLKMDELLADSSLPHNKPLNGRFSKEQSGGVEAGWQAQAMYFDSLTPQPVPGQTAIDRVVLEIWWIDGVTRRTFALDGYRRAMVRPGAQ